MEGQIAGGDEHMARAQPGAPGRRRGGQQVGGARRTFQVSATEPQPPHVSTEVSGLAGQDKSAAHGIDKSGRPGYPPGTGAHGVILSPAPS